MKPKVLVFRTAGTNCDKETAFAFEQAKAEAEILHINYVKKQRDLSKFDILCIPGGFSYGDDLGAGKILALEFMLWFKDELTNFVEKGGLVLGICNGFQVLTKIGLLPDTDFNQKVTLIDNNSARFEDRWVFLETNQEKKSLPRKIWLKDFPDIVEFPIAHGEGKFYTDDKTLEKIEANGQIAFRYSNGESGQEGASYPFNPNGSLNNIAGIVDKTGKVLGLMPHPERASLEHHNPRWQQKNIFPWGAKLFENAVNYCKDIKG